MEKIKKNTLFCVSCCAIAFLFCNHAAAADKVVVVPLGGAVGNAAASDVLNGKTFSSKTAGKGITGTLEILDGSILYINSIGMKFSLIPAGSFIMGSPDGSGDSLHPPVQTAELGRDSDEKQHQVTLTNPFYMQTTEVTQGQWLAVVGGANPSNFDTCGMDCPVDSVSWNDTQNFIDALNAMEGYTNCNTTPNSCYTLPTEAQWEYAARAGTVTAFYNGDITESNGDDPNLNEIGWYVQNADNTTHPVAQKQPNSFGLYDMSGNAQEWCQDWYDVYLDGPLTDPAGPAFGSNRVLHGSSWSNSARYLRSANRYRTSPDNRNSNYGFRLVKTP